ncbi:triose-phosphate isomerase [Desulfobulbus alkaliphilus]|uniref:triose-phosphate isomerase n=1 Tax=Desulfobulbus alkaliphilus TaxID=869814 RepID=UPI0019660FAF|nr:triose-phosphate isomerase [Desulfobulbus alkaliphilus]MBM9536588.1 triose-phosphate isomerase [Desulfobulbus alkaliphilus]
MSRRPLLAGNWKMYLTSGEAVRLAQAIAAISREHTDRDVMVAPSFTSLAAVAAELRNSAVLLGAQNVAWEQEGAYTGEISPRMLTDLGVRMAIIGHSERRHIFGEDNVMVNQRLLAALDAGLVPVLCIGETLDERQAEATFKVLETQLCEGLENVPPARAEQVVLAYEPVWAIGTGKTATPQQAQEVHHFLRQLLAGLYDKKIAETVRVLYGGSVKPDNIDELMAQPDIDGALVGGAALNPDSFARIVHFT